MTHIEEDKNGNIKMKTAGQLVDNLVTPEGKEKFKINIVTIRSKGLPDEQ